MTTVLSSKVFLQKLTPLLFRTLLVLKVLCGVLAYFSFFFQWKYPHCSRLISKWTKLCDVLHFSEVDIISPLSYRSDAIKNASYESQEVHLLLSFCRSQTDTTDNLICLEVWKKIYVRFPFALFLYKKCVWFLNSFFKCEEYSCNN